MSEVYKKFTAQDYSIVPFNAHKQYKFTSQSAVDNNITWHKVSWTSESISLYTSASSHYGSDTINTVKYNQIDHLFYKNFKKDISNRFGYNNYLKQQRKLYSKAQILSIPSGLYGHEIKPQSYSPIIYFGIQTQQKNRLYNLHLLKVEKSNYYVNILEDHLHIRHLYAMAQYQSQDLALP